MHAIRVFTDCISRQGISCVCPSFCFHSSFWGKWPFTLSFLHWHDSRLLLESQGYVSRVRVSKVGNMVSLTSIFDWSQKWVSLIKAMSMIEAECRPLPRRVQRESHQWVKWSRGHSVARCHHSRQRSTACGRTLQLRGPRGPLAACNVGLTSNISMQTLLLSLGTRLMASFPGQPR